MAVDIIEAVVQSGSNETNYVRAGHGKAVVLLRSSTTPLETDPLFQQLAAENRVIVPDLGSAQGEAGFAEWLRDFVDGLGGDVPRVVVAAEDPQQIIELIQRLRD